MNTGSCQCNSVRYEITQQPFDCLYCHCSICRRLTGSAMASYGSVRRESFIWLAGEELLTTFMQNDACARNFCSICGSNIHSTHALDPVHLFLSLGCLDTHEDIEIKYQQFVKSKADWSMLDSTVPAHDEWPDWISDKISALKTSKQG